MQTPKKYELSVKCIERNGRVIFCHALGVVSSDELQDPLKVVTASQNTASAICYEQNDISCIPFT